MEKQKEQEQQEDVSTYNINEDGTIIWDGPKYQQLWDNLPNKLKEEFIKDNLIMLSTSRQNLFPTLARTSPVSILIILILNLFFSEKKHKSLAQIAKEENIVPAAIMKKYNLVSV